MKQYYSFEREIMFGNKITILIFVFERQAVLRE